METSSTPNYQLGNVPLTALVNFPGQLPMTIDLQKGACSYADMTTWQQAHGRICNGTKCLRQESPHCALSLQLSDLVDLFRNIPSFTTGTLRIYKAGYATEHYKEDAQTIFFRLLWLTICHAISAYFGYKANQLAHHITTTIPELKSLLSPKSPPTQARITNTQSRDLFAGQLAQFIKTLKNVYQQIDSNTLQHGDCSRNGWTILWNIFLLVELTLASSAEDAPPAEC